MDLYKLCKGSNIWRLLSQAAVWSETHETLWDFLMDGGEGARILNTHLTYIICKWGCKPCGPLRMRKLGSAGAVVPGPRGSVDADGTEARKGGQTKWFGDKWWKRMKKGAWVVPSNVKWWKRGCGLGKDSDHTVLQFLLQNYVRVFAGGVPTLQIPSDPCILQDKWCWYGCSTNAVAGGCTCTLSVSLRVLTLMRFLSCHAAPGLHMPGSAAFGISSVHRAEDHSYRGKSARNSFKTKQRQVAPVVSVLIVPSHQPGKVLAARRRETGCHCSRWCAWMRGLNAGYDIYIRFCSR